MIDQINCAFEASTVTPPLNQREHKKTTTAQHPIRQQARPGLPIIKDGQQPRMDRGSNI
jgi:hypothetical protein